MRKSTGIIRRVDDLGRVVIPKSIRQKMGVHEGDPLEIYLSEDSKSVEFRKYYTLEPIMGTLKKVVSTFQTDSGVTCYVFLDNECLSHNITHVVRDDVCVTVKTGGMELLLGEELFEDCENYPITHIRSICTDSDNVVGFVVCVKKAPTCEDLVRIDSYVNVMQSFL